MWCTEYPVYSIEQGVVGRIDAIYKNYDGTYDIVDWKTTTSDTVAQLYHHKPASTMFKQSLVFKNPFNKYYDTKFNRDFLQLNIYRTLFEQNLNCKVKNMFLMVFANKETQVLKIDRSNDIDYIFATKERFEQTIELLKKN